MQYIAEKNATTRRKALIRLAHEAGGCIVCRNLQAKADIRFLAHRMKMDIQMPITYEDFVQGWYNTRQVRAFLIDGCEDFFKCLSPQVPVYVIAGEQEQ